MKLYKWDKFTLRMTTYTDEISSFVVAEDINEAIELVILKAEQNYTHEAVSLLKNFLRTNDVTVLELPVCVMFTTKYKNGKP
jgi:hypothetical protein